MTMMKEYIRQAIKDYDAPTDKSGVARGDTLPFTKEKYAASLYVALTNYSLKEVANIVKMPHETVRRWNTEDRFKHQVVRHQRDYVNHLLDYFKDKAAELRLAENAFMARPIDEVAIELLPIVDVRAELNDAGIYNEELMYMTMPRLFELFGGVDYLHFRVNILEIFSDILTEDTWNSVKEEANQAVRMSLILIAKGQVNNDLEAMAKLAMYSKRIEERIDANRK